MRASATAKLLKWACSTQSASHNGFGIDRGSPSLTPKNGYVNMGNAIAQIMWARRAERHMDRHFNILMQHTHVVVHICVFSNGWNELFVVGLGVEHCGAAGGF